MPYLRDRTLKAQAKKERTEKTNKKSDDKKKPSTPIFAYSIRLDIANISHERQVYLLYYVITARGEYTIQCSVPINKQVAKKVSFGLRCQKDCVRLFFSLSLSLRFRWNGSFFVVAKYRKRERKKNKTKSAKQTTKLKQN